MEKKIIKKPEISKEEEEKRFLELKFPKKKGSHLRMNRLKADEYGDIETSRQKGGKKNNNMTALQHTVNAIETKELSKKKKKQLVGDMDVPIKESKLNVNTPITKKIETIKQEPAKKRKKSRQKSDPLDINEEEDEIYRETAKQHALKKFAKKAKYSVEPDFSVMGIPEVDNLEKRGVTREIMKNRGLVPHKKKSNRNPRVKKREQYKKALRKRKSQVKDVIVGEAGRYGGEVTGIKVGISRSRQLKN